MSGVKWATQIVKSIELRFKRVKKLEAYGWSSSKEENK
jgi:hypothetical protein